MLDNSDDRLTPNERWDVEESTSCLVCGHGQLKAVHESKPRGIPLRFVRCVGCGFIFQNPRLTPEALESYFNSGTFISDGSFNENALNEQLGYFNYFEWDESYRLTAARRLDTVGRHRPPPAKLLEIGSATGSFLAAARDRGYSVRGLDISRTFAQMAGRRHDVEVDVGWIETFPLPRQHYDVICVFGGISCWRDFMQGLRNVRSALKPEGILVFNYSDRSSVRAKAMGDRDSEFNHASMSILHRNAVTKCLLQAGFSVASDRTEWQIASIGRIVTYLKMSTAKRVADRLHLQNFKLPVLAIGTRLVVARP
jgi:SAM-dependent methyltransferase